MQNADIHTKSDSLAIVKGLQCLVHHLDPGFLILDPFKTVVEFLQRRYLLDGKSGGMSQFRKGRDSNMCAN
jgi:hypothetical protein